MILIDVIKRHSLLYFSFMTNFHTIFFHLLSFFNTYSIAQSTLCFESKHHSSIIVRKERNAKNVNESAHFTSYENKKYFRKQNAAKKYCDLSTLATLFRYFITWNIDDNNFLNDDNDRELFKRQCDKFKIANLF